MRILIDVNHPAQVHLFRNAVRQWEAHGHKVLIVGRDKDVTLALLEGYELPYVRGTARKPGFVGLAGELLSKTALLVRISRDFKPHVFLSVGSPPAAWASTSVRVPHLVFEDDRLESMELDYIRMHSSRLIRQGLSGCRRSALACRR